MALNGKHASMLRGQQRVNQRHLKRNMSSVRTFPFSPQCFSIPWPPLLVMRVVLRKLVSQALHAPSQACCCEDRDLPGR